jgi:hypothetical protein
MQAVVQLGKLCAEQPAGSSCADYLIGSADKADDPAGASTKPMHPCFLVPTEDTEEEDDPPLNLFALIEEGNKIELQYGVLVFLTVDAKARERVASLSPPHAAHLTRQIPTFVYKSLLGTPNSAAQPPIELVIRFTCEIERIYKL